MNSSISKEEQFERFLESFPEYKNQVSSYRLSDDKFGLVIFLYGGHKLLFYPKNQITPFKEF